MERVLNREGTRFLFAQVYSCQIYFLNENDEAAEHNIYIRHPILLPEAWGCCAIRQCPILRPVHTLTFTLFQFSSVQFSSVAQSCQLFVTPWTAACQASLSITNSRSLLKLMSIKSVMAYNHLILCRPLFLPSSLFPSIRVFSNESDLCIRWPKYWSFSFTLFRNT